VLTLKLVNRSEMGSSNSGTAILPNPRVNARCVATSHAVCATTDYDGESELLVARQQFGGFLKQDGGIVDDAGVYRASGDFHLFTAQRHADVLTDVSARGTWSVLRGRGHAFCRQQRAAMQTRDRCHSGRDYYRLTLMSLCITVVTPEGIAAAGESRQTQFVGGMNRVGSDNAVKVCQRRPDGDF